jgi:chitin disaccharide deacetylase
VSPVRRLVVNADDFGRSAAINAGVIQAHVHGIVTCASLMVRHAAAPEAAAAAGEHPTLGLGLHLDLAEWERVDGEWRATYIVADTDDRRAVALEVERQLECFRSLVGADPTHLDSHQHVHREEPVRSVAAEVASGLGVPLRGRSEVRYCGAFYGQDRGGRSMPSAVGAKALAALIRALPEGDTELCCHPATRAEPFTSYAAERPLELRALCDPRVRAAVDEGGIALCGFRDLVSADGRFAEARHRRA